MSFMQAVPELADGGYWYVVPVVPDPEIGGRTPGEIPGAGWCAWYHPTEPRCIVRTPELMTIPQAIPLSADIAKARGRIGGR